MTAHGTPRLAKFALALLLAGSAAATSRPAAAESWHFGYDSSYNSYTNHTRNTWRGSDRSYRDNRNTSRGTDRSSTAGNVAGQFDYYALVLSWSPTHCAGNSRGGDDLQCNAGRPYSFVLHGLWPQFEKRWPQDCPINGSTFVPNPVIHDMLEIMPAKPLIIHEYKKHGTCSGMSPAQYFRFARGQFNRIKVPARYVSPAAAQFVSPSDLKTEFLQANPEFTADMIGVACGRGNDNRLQEIHFCIDRNGAPRHCGQNEAPSRMCQAAKMYVPPARVSAGGGRAGVSPR